MFLRASPLLFVLIIGCTTTRTEETKTGLFKNDPEKMIEAYKRIEPFKTTRKDLEKEWDFSVPNVAHLPGPDALRVLLGDQAFQGLLRDFFHDGRLDDLFKELNRYEMINIPYREVTTTKDRAYVSTQETKRVGREITLTIVLKDDLVIYRPVPKDAKINEKTSDYAILQGLLDILERYGGFADNIKDLVDKIRELMEKR